tara:strand:- start:207 stop:410 length:204 start_codon:yes stop_codon:yes gene_type:complete
MQIKDIQQNKEIDRVIETQVNYLFHDLLTGVNEHGRRYHRFTVGKQKEFTHAIMRHIILQLKLQEEI